MVTSSTTEWTCRTQVKPGQMIDLYSRIFSCDATRNTPQMFSRHATARDQANRDCQGQEAEQDGAVTSASKTVV